MERSSFTPLSRKVKDILEENRGQFSSLHVILRGHTKVRHVPVTICEAKFQ
jgi:hypothetical protein